MRLKPAPVPEAISEAQLVALQARRESLHALGPLSDAEPFAMEDTAAGFLERRASVTAITFDMLYTAHADYAGTPSPSVAAKWAAQNGQLSALRVQSRCAEPAREWRRRGRLATPAGRVHKAIGETLAEHVLANVR
jgi:hypothetical protein